MKSKDVQIDGHYFAKVSGKRVTVVITGQSLHGGWVALNKLTGREIHIRFPRRLTERTMTLRLGTKSLAALGLPAVPYLATFPVDENNVPVDNGVVRCYPKNEGDGPTINVRYNEWREKRAAWEAANAEIEKKEREDKINKQFEGANHD